jgi:hypothetical protein
MQQTNKQQQQLQKQDGEEVEEDVYGLCHRSACGVQMAYYTVR